MIKTIIVLLTFAFKCRLVNETHAIVLVHAGTQANRLAITIDCTCNKFYQKSHHQKFLFFSRLKRDVLFNFVCHKKLSEKHPIHKNNTYIV